MASLHAPALLSRDDQADQFLQLIKSPFNTQVSTTAFWSSLGYSIGFAVLCAILFCLLRPYNRTVYAPRLKHADEKRAPPPIDNGVFGWVQPVVKTTDQVLVDKIGEDGAVFLRFTQMCRNIMLVLSVVGCAVYIPINLTGNRETIARYPDAAMESTAFGDLTPMHVTGAYCWAYVAITYVFNIVVCFFLWTNYRAVTDLRRQYFDSPDYQSSLHARTLLVTDVPKNYRSDEGVSRIVDEVSTDGDPSGAIAHNVKGLPELIEEHEETVRELEAVLAKYLKNPDKLPAKRPKCRTHREDRDHTTGSKVDAIDYLTSRIEKLSTKIHDARKAVGNRKVLPYGFVSFPNIEQAHDLAYAARKKHPQGTTVQLAPKPGDLIWKNLPLDPKTRSWRSFMNNVWVTALTLVWTVPNALIAVFLANLSNLGSVWPAFHEEMSRDPKIWGAIQGILAPLVTTLFYMVLPTIFRRLSAYAGDYSKTERERHVTHRLYAFFLFNNLIVFSLFSAGWTYATAVIEAQRTNDLWTSLRKTEPFQNLVGAFCNVSPFWLNYLLQRNLGAAIDISQLAKLSQGWLKRKLFHPTPRENIELTAPPPFDYASYYNNFLFYMTVALVFAPFQPLVLPVAAFYFSLDHYLKKYLLMYVFVTKHESGGAFWKLLANRMLVASFLSNIFAFLFVAARRNKGEYAQLIVMAPVILILLGFKIYCMKTFDDDQHYYSKGLKGVKEEGLPSRRKGEKVGVRFGHPALYQKLMVPMVHARAQHILKDIYRGRLDSGFDDVNGYGESYKLQNMSKKQSGQAGGSAAPFELVHESEMDFAHYRDRADFRGEVGDGAHLYGQSAEASRPGTPSTLQASRAASPAPSVGFPSAYDTEATVTPDGGDGVTYPNGYFAPPGAMGTPGRSPLARQDSDEDYVSATPNQPPPLDRTNSHSRLL